MVYILYYTGMHGSMLTKIMEKNLIKQGEKVYIEGQRPKTQKTMRAQSSVQKPYLF